MTPEDNFQPEDFLPRAENIYEAVLTISKRARQIGELHKRHIDRYLGQTEMLEQAAARARADDSDELPEIEPIDRPKLHFEKPVMLSMREMKEGTIEHYYEE